MNKTRLPFRNVMRYVWISLCFLTFLGIFQIASAQNSDIGLWSGVTLKKKVTKKVSFHLRQEFRFNQNISLLKQNLTEVGLHYKLGKRTTLIPGYRFSFLRSGINHRIYTDLIHKLNTNGKLPTIEFRLRGLRSFSGEGDWNYTIRTRAQFAYPIEDFPMKPFVSAELFYSFVPTTHDFSRYRFVAGSKFKISDTFSLSTAYQFQKKMNKTDPISENNILVALKVNLK